MNFTMCRINSILKKLGLELNTPRTDGIYTIKRISDVFAIPCSNNPLSIAGISMICIFIPSKLRVPIWRVFVV